MSSRKPLLSLVLALSIVVVFSACSRSKRSAATMNSTTQTSTTPGGIINDGGGGNTPTTTPTTVPTVGRTPTPTPTATRTPRSTPTPTPIPTSTPTQRPVVNNALINLTGVYSRWRDVSTTPATMRWRVNPLTNSTTFPAGSLELQFRYSTDANGQLLDNPAKFGYEIADPYVEPKIDFLGFHGKGTDSNGNAKVYGNPLNFNTAACPLGSISTLVIRDINLDRDLTMCWKWHVAGQSPTGLSGQGLFGGFYGPYRDGSVIRYHNNPAPGAGGQNCPDGYKVAQILGATNDKPLYLCYL